MAQKKKQTKKKAAKKKAGKRKPVAKKKKAARKKAKTAPTTSSGVVYSDPLREAIARRLGRIR